MRDDVEHLRNSFQVGEWHAGELDLALLLVNSLDSYREKVDALIAAKLEGVAVEEVKCILRVGRTTCCGYQS